MQSFDCTKYNRYGFTAKGQDRANVMPILCLMEKGVDALFKVSCTLAKIGYLFPIRVCEEKSVIKIFYDNDWGWKLVPELASLVLYITGLSGHVKSRRKFPPVLLEIYGLFW